MEALSAVQNIIFNVNDDVNMKLKGDDDQRKLVINVMIVNLNLMINVDLSMTVNLMTNLNLKRY